MKNIFNIRKAIFLTALFSVILIGCKDEQFLPGADRLFRPMIKSDTVSMTWITINWDQYKGAKSYEVQMSVDTFKTVLRTDRTKGTRYLFDNLDFDTKYQIRLRAIGDSILSTGDTITSKYFTKDLSTLDYPTLLIDPTSSDEIDNSVRVKWKTSSMVYSRIDVMVNKDSVYKSFSVTSADNLAGEKIISGLQPATTYIVKIFVGNEFNDYRGKKTFKTAASQNFIGDVVDLRDSSDVAAQTFFSTQAIFDNLAVLHPNGFNMILSGGVTYTLPTLNVSVPINMVTGLSFKGKAIVAVNGSFGITAGIKVSKLRFEKIFFTGGNISGKLKTDGNYGGTYLINMNQLNGNLDTLQFENCDVKYKRGAIRMQTTATVGLVKVNNCLFDSIGGYGIVNNANANSRIENIVLSNSTIAHADKLLVCGQAKSVNSIAISNITTYFAPMTAGYFLDYNTNDVPGGVTIMNSVFGPGFTGSLVTPVAMASVNGTRFAATTTPTFINCYKTSDLTWTMKADLITPNAPITALVDLALPSTTVFAGAATSNFKVTDSRLVKLIGDPRWW